MSTGSRGRPAVTNIRADGGTRRGLVLGAGGVLGFTWTVAALHAFEQFAGVDARSVEICVGTSAGSVAAALLSHGVSVDAMLRHQRGVSRSDDPFISWDYDGDVGGALPPRPGLAPGSPQLIAQVMRHPRRIPVTAALSAVLPRGRATLDPVHRMIGDLAGDAPWPEQPRPWVVAFDYDAGRRVAFGRAGAPEAPLPDAVTASCAIPGWYAPVAIDDRRYIDGGVCSPTSLDLLAGLGLDEVVVLAPLISFAFDRPRSAVARVERGWRRGQTRRLLREAEKVRAAGTEVTMLGPGPEDLAAIGSNLMNPSRRGQVLDTALRTCFAALTALPAEARR